MAHQIGDVLLLAAEASVKKERRRQEQQHEQIEDHVRAVADADQDGDGLHQIGKGDRRPRCDPDQARTSRRPCGPVERRPRITSLPSTPTSTASVTY